MTNRHRNQAQAVSVNRRRLAPVLQVVPRNMLPAAGQTVSGIRRDFLRRVDFHPALFMLTGVAILALVGIIYLGQVTAVTNANYTVQALQDEHDSLVKERQDLQLQIARSQSLSRIEQVARDKLHMVPIGDKYKYLPVAPGLVQGLSNIQPDVSGQQATPVPAP